MLYASYSFMIYALHTCMLTPLPPRCTHAYIGIFPFLSYPLQISEIAIIDHTRLVQLYLDYPSNVNMQIVYICYTFLPDIQLIQHICCNSSFPSFHISFVIQFSVILSF